MRITDSILQRKMNFWRREEGGGGSDCELVGEQMATLVGNGVCLHYENEYREAIFINSE